MSRPRGFLLTFALFSIIAPVAQAQPPALGPRRVHDAARHAELPAHRFAGVIMAKFKDGTELFLEPGVVLGGARGPVLLDLADVPGARADLAPGFVGDVDPKLLAAVSAAARQRCHCSIPDMATWVRIRMTDGAPAGPALDALAAHGSVEVAYPLARRAPSPMADLPPTTPGYVDRQGYRGPAPDGMGIQDARTLPGGDGALLDIVDVEVDWTADHEDLPCAGQQVPGSGTIYPGLEYEFYGAHGTAVLSILVGGENGYGVTGLVPAARCHYAPDYTQERGPDVAGALMVSMTSGVLGVGDVLVMENQTDGPGYNEQTGEGLVPSEWEPATYDAIRTLVGAGAVVVEAAGNGYVDLDHAVYGGAFDRSRSDSGAIVVGAGAPPDTGVPARSRLDFSNWGSRVDVQGWGAAVYSAGYGDLFLGDNDVRQAYSAEFAGTSSASPLVAGVAGLVESIQLAGGGAVLDGVTLRAVLVATGTAQQGDTSQNIGPQPDAWAAVHAVRVCGNLRLDWSEACDDGNTTSGDGCNAECTSNETCGNGFTDLSSGEACDDGNNVDGDGCSSACSSDETCGNGVVDEARGETCDDGNTVPGDGCSGQCATETGVGVPLPGGTRVALPPLRCTCSNAGDGTGPGAMAVMLAAAIARRRIRRVTRVSF